MLLDQPAPGGCEWAKYALTTSALLHDGVWSALFHTLQEFGQRFPLQVLRVLSDLFEFILKLSFGVVWPLGAKTEVERCAISQR